MFKKFLKELNETLMVVVGIFGVLGLVFMLAGICFELGKSSQLHDFEDQTISDVK